MGPMWNNLKLMPKDHWIHKALAKEGDRVKKKKAANGAVSEKMAVVEEKNGSDMADTSGVN